jgi:signal transduction histidine kinase
LRALIIKLLTVHRAVADRKGLTLEFRADENLPRKLKTDAARLSQVLINLISNAVKFTDQGLVCIEVRYTPNKESVPDDHAHSEPVRERLDPGVSNYVKYEAIKPRSLFDNLSDFSDSFDYMDSTEIE